MNSSMTISTRTSFRSINTSDTTPVVEYEEPSIDSVKRSLLSLSSTQRALLGAVAKLFQLLLILPATNATSECSFNAVRALNPT